MVHNTISTVNAQLIVQYEWCVNPDAKPAGCSYAALTWVFSQLTSPQFGMKYQVVTMPGNVLTAGTLTAIYGTLTGKCEQITAPWSGTALTSDGTKVPLSIWTRGSEICSTVTRPSGTGWVTEAQCPLVNLFQDCGTSLIPLKVF